MTINCEFSEPIFLEESTKDFEFSKMDCQYQEATTTPHQVISDGEIYFNLYPNFTYAEIIIIFFLVLFFFIKIYSVIWNFVHDFIIRQKWLR